MPALPRQRFGVVDVRDVADAHITAMATPAAAGKRYLLLADGPTITWLGLAQILRDHLGPAGEPRHNRRGARRGPAAADDPQRPRQAGARLATTPGRDHDRRDRRQPARARPAGEAMTSDDTATALITDPTGGLYAPDLRDDRRADCDLRLDAVPASVPCTPADDWPVWLVVRGRAGTVRVGSASRLRASLRRTTAATGTVGSTVPAGHGAAGPSAGPQWLGPGGEFLLKPGAS